MTDSLKIRPVKPLTPAPLPEGARESVQGTDPQCAEKIIEHLD